MLVSVYASDNGLVKVLDTTKLASIGFSFESGHAVKYTFFFLRDAKANLPEGANAADLAKSTDEYSLPISLFLLIYEQAEIIRLYYFFPRLA